MSNKNVEKNLVLLGVAEIAEALGVTKQTVSNWRSRDEGFPAPTADLKSGPVWLQEVIMSWAHASGYRISLTSVADVLQLGPRKNATVCAVMNAKGGVGKSTVALNLGWTTFLHFNKRVLLIDLDPQFNLSQYVLGSDAYEKLILDGRPTTANIFAGALDLKSNSISADAVCKIRSGRNGSRLDLIPSNLELAWIVRDGYGKDGLLDSYITHRIGKDKYDLILIDCPPTDSTLADAAYTASDWILIPVRPEFLPAIGLPLIDLSLRKFLSTKPQSSVQVAGIVLNGVVGSKQEYKRSKEDILGAAKEFNWPVFKNEISASESYPKGSRLGLPIMMTNHARWEKVSEFTAFAQEFVDRISL